MSFQIHEWSPHSEKIDLEEARVSTIPGDDGPPHLYYLDAPDGRLRPSWRLFGFCFLVGLVNVFSTFFTLAVTTNLRSSDIILESNLLLLSTGFLISLFWRLHSPSCQYAKKCYHPNDENLSRFRLRSAGSLLAIMFSPAVACLPLLLMFWLPGCEYPLYDIPGMPLFISWAAIDALAFLLVPRSIGRQDRAGQSESSKGCARSPQGAEGHEDCNYFDETDGPTFLPQQPISTYDFEGVVTQEMKAASTLIPRVSWEDTIESYDALRETVRWAITVPEEFLQPSVAELLAMAAVSIGVSLDGMEDWDQGVQYTYLVSRTCDRLAEIFQQAEPAAVPVHAVNVFLFVDRFEQFGGIDAAPLSSEHCFVSVEELDRVVHCLRARSVSLLGC